MPKATESDRDWFSMSAIVRSTDLKSVDAADAASRRAEADVEARMFKALRRRFSGQTVYCYDQSHMNRFADQQPPREWNAVAPTFKGCLKLAQERFASRGDDEQWRLIDQQLQTHFAQGKEPNADQRFVFEAGRYWYCFFCLSVDEFCDKVVQHIAWKRQEAERNARQQSSTDYYDCL